MPVYLFVIAVALPIAVSPGWLFAGATFAYVGFRIGGAMGMFAMIMFFKVFMGTNPIAVADSNRPCRSAPLGLWRIYLCRCKPCRSKRLNQGVDTRLDAINFRAGYETFIVLPLG